MEMVDGAKVGTMIKCIETKRIAIFAIAKNANIAMFFSVIWVEMMAFFCNIPISDKPSRQPSANVRTGKVKSSATSPILFLADDFEWPNPSWDVSQKMLGVADTEHDG